MNKNYLLELVKIQKKKNPLYKVENFQLVPFFNGSFSLFTSKSSKLWERLSILSDVSGILSRKFKPNWKMASTVIAFSILGDGLQAQSSETSDPANFKTHADRTYEMYRDIRPNGSELWNAFEPDFSIESFSGGSQVAVVNFELSQEVLRSSLQYKYGLESYIERDSIWQDRVEKHIANGVYPIGLVDLRVQHINPALLNSGLRLSADSSRYELNLDGFVAPIFQESYLFASVLPLERMRNDVEWMVLDSNLYVSNFHKPEKIRVRVNSTTIWVEWNVPFKVPAGTGNLDLDIDLLLDEEDERGQFLEDPIQWNPFKYFTRCKANIYVNAKVQPPLLDPLEVRIYDYSDVGKSPYHKARYTVHMGYDSFSGGKVQHDCMRKPLVIVEGVDYGYPGIKGIKDGKYGENGYIDILNGRSWNASSQTWEPWKSIEKGPYMIRRLRNLGYDIIYVDFYDGAADININADVLQGVLEEIKRINCGNSMHVIGISMGGLVAKRTLKKMENEGNTHCVTTFTSFDAPYWGANIPMGLQHIIRYYSKSKNVAKDGLHRILRRPASLQMLANHEASNKQHHSYRTLFMREDSLLGGFPQKPLLFAITNGSAKGTASRQPDAWGSNARMQPGQLIFRLQLKGISKVKTTPWIDVFAENFYDKKNQVYYSGKVAGNKPFYTHKDNHLWDHISGSRINKFGSLRNVSSMLKVGLEAPYTCFVPTVSALSLNSDVYTFNSLLDFPLTVKDQDLENPLGAEVNTPFSRIYIPAENQDHVMLDSTPQGNINWLIVQLENAEKGFQLGMGSDIKKTSGVFNLNSPWNKFIPNGELSGTAVMEVNGKGLLPQLSWSELQLVKSLKERHYYTGSCNYVNLKFDDAAKMEIGSTGGSKTVVHWDGKSIMEFNKTASLVIKENHEIRIYKGARMIFDDQSVLNLYSGSKLIVEEGAWLILRGEAKLILDKECELHIKGNLVLGDEYNFQPQKGISGSIGLVKITNKGYGFGEGEIYFEGLNAQIQLEGNGKEGKGNFQLEGKIELPLAKTGNPLKTVKLNNTHGIFAPGSQWIISGDVEMGSTKFVMVDWTNQLNNGNKDVGIKYQGSTLRLKDVEFIGLDTALTVLYTSGSNQVLWQNLLFENCTVGLNTKGLKGRIDQCSFKNNKTGLTAHDIESELVITEGEFRNNTEAIIANQWEQSKGKLWLIECLFDRNWNAVNSLYGNLIMKCNRFNLSETDIVIEGGVLNISNTNAIKSDVLSRNEKPGYNVFVNSKKRCIGLYGSELFMNGENYFHFNKVKYDGRPFIEGQIVVDENAEYWNMKEGKFISGSNVWSPSQGLVASDLDEQYIRLKRQNRSNMVLDIEGSLLKYYPAEACFYASELDPNELVTQKLSGDQLNGQKSSESSIRVYGVSGGLMIWGKDVVWECFNSAGSLIQRGETKYEREFVPMSSGIYFIRLKETAKGESYKVFIPEN